MCVDLQMLMQVGQRLWRQAQRLRDPPSACAISQVLGEPLQTVLCLHYHLQVSLALPHLQAAVAQSFWTQDLRCCRL